MCNNFPPLYYIIEENNGHCISADSVILIQGSAGGIRNCRGNPLTSISCLLCCCHLSCSSCSNKQIKWEKLIPLVPLWAFHVTCHRPSYFCVLVVCVWEREHKFRGVCQCSGLHAIQGPYWEVMSRGRDEWLSRDTSTLSIMR